MPCDSPRSGSTLDPRTGAAGSPVRLVRIVILLALSAIGSMSPKLALGASAEDAAGASAEDAAGSRVGEADGRFYFRLAPQGLEFSSQVDDRITPTPPEFRYEKSHGGLALALGYDFGPRFGVEMALGFTPLDSEPEGTEVALATVSFLAVVPLAHYGPLRALVVGGLGFGFLPQNGPDFTERSYLSESGNFGLRLRCRTVRHLRIIAGADYAIHDISWEFVPSNPPDDDLRDIGGKLWVRSFFAGLEFHL